MKLSLSAVICFAAVASAGILAPSVDQNDKGVPLTTEVIQMGKCEGIAGQLLCSTKCALHALQPMCVDGTCYCTSVGDGGCAADNNKGCKSVCAALAKVSKGCNKDECICEDPSSGIAGNSTIPANSSTTSASTTPTPTPAKAN